MSAFQLQQDVIHISQTTILTKWNVLDEPSLRKVQELLGAVERSMISSHDVLVGQGPKTFTRTAM